MDIDNFLQEIKQINWFEHNRESAIAYHVIFSIFEAYDTWNKQMLKNMGATYFFFGKYSNRPDWRFTN